MSLSIIARAIVFGLLLFAASFAGREYARPALTYLIEARNFDARDAQISRRSITYRLSNDSPVTFVYSQPVTRTKILVHPAVEEKYHDHARGFVFGLRMRWVSSEGEVLEEYETYLQADSPDEVFVSGDILRFFRVRDELVAEQDVVFLESSTPATRLQVEAFDLDEGIVGIDVRIFERRAYLGTQSRTAFQRLSKDAKDQLLAPNPFPASMLTQDEMLVLGRNHWRAVGPLGLDGRDYTKLVVYEAKREHLSSDDFGIAGGGS